MPVSKARMSEILQLSNGERVHFVDTNGFTEEDWRRFGDEVDKEIIAFCRDCRDPEDLHAFAETWNWDQGEWALEELLDNPACEAATALMLYWVAGPEYFLQYADRDALVATGFTSNLEIFDFVVKLEARYIAGEFRPGCLGFDPKCASPQRVGIYDDMRDKFVRALPDVMYLPVKPVA